MNRFCWSFWRSKNRVNFPKRNLGRENFGLSPIFDDFPDLKTGVKAAPRKEK